MICLLDTNIFLRSLVPENEKDFMECKKLLARIRNLEIEAKTCGLVLAEIAWTLKTTYKLKREEIAEKIAGVLRLANIGIVDTYDWTVATDLFRQKNVKFVDAAIASIEEVSIKKWAVVSYDEDFKKLPVKWLKPGEV